MATHGKKPWVASGLSSSRSESVHILAVKTEQGSETYWLLRSSPFEIEEIGPIYVTVEL